MICFRYDSFTLRGKKSILSSTVCCAGMATWSVNMLSTLLTKRTATRVPRSEWFVTAMCDVLRAPTLAVPKSTTLGCTEMNGVQVRVWHTSVRRCRPRRAWALPEARA